MAEKIDTAALLRSVDIVEVAGRYTKLKKQGREYVGLCPFHADKKPSFHVVPEKGFAHCFACQWNGDAIDLVCEGSSVDFVEACKRLGAGDYKPDETRARAQIEKAPTRITLPPPADATPPNMRTRHWGEPRRVWEYRDGTGALLFYVARYEWTDDGKSHKATPQWSWGSVDGGESWRWGLGHYHEPRPLYGLDRLAARPTAPVLICEGEKAADAGGELLPMYVSMSWPGGTNGVDKADWSPLRGRRVLIWPDRDLQRDDDGELKPLGEQPGYAAAVQIAEILARVGADEIKIINVGVGA